MRSPKAPSINPAIIRSYDIRGVVGQQLGLADAHALGLAYAAHAIARGKHRIAVSRDGRLSSPDLEAALAAGLTAGGMNVLRLGVGPTPRMYFAVQAAELEGGVMVTGSHNPPEQNGFKLVLDGEPVFGAALKRLVATPATKRPGGATHDLYLGGIEITTHYVRRLAAVAAGAGELHVVWDCGHGAVGTVIGALVARLPGQHTLLNARVDGSFPAHHPDPAVPANLRQLQTMVVAKGADLGIAFDGDGDRIGVVDATGRIIWPDQLVLFLALEILAAHPGATVVADVKSSRVLFDEVERLGGRAVMVPSGYVIVREAMLREKAPLAGEMSGHIVYADCWHASDDALYVAMRLLAALGNQGCTLAEFRESLPRMSATPELRVACPESRKQATIREVAARLVARGAKVDTTDGLRVTADEGWWLLRASGTEPKLTARCEAADPDGLERLRGELLSHLRQSGIRC
ncbi:MAG TPA: phosphomannomutase/phosphoglucomutase [Steroidobacteraceae bacterium]|nr:phosphomannomutase/phosphoglucomutase [Steroidobacteraceae bacterium]